MKMWILIVAPKGVYAVFVFPSNFSHLVIPKQAKRSPLDIQFAPRLAPDCETRTSLDCRCLHSVVHVTQRRIAPTTTC